MGCAGCTSRRCASAMGANRESLAEMNTTCVEHWGGIERTWSQYARMSDCKHLWQGSMMHAGKQHGVHVGRQHEVYAGRQHGVHVGRQHGVHVGRQHGVHVGRQHGVHL